MLTIIPLQAMLTILSEKFVRYHINSIKKQLLFQLQRMKKKVDHRPRNSAQYKRIVELLIMHKAKRTPRQISFLPVRFHDEGRSSDNFENLVISQL